MAKSKKVRKINIIDTTMRNGEKTAGVVFSKHEKIRIAKMLDDTGIPEIEVGTPGLGGVETDMIKAVLKANLSSRLYAYCNAEIEDIKTTAGIGVKNVVINLSTSDIHLKKLYKENRTWLVNRLREVMRVANKLDLKFIISAEDATRTDLEFLLKIISLSKKKGAERFRICDTVSKFDPFRTFMIISTIKNTIDFPIEVYNHNDFGMATANGMAAIRGGAESIVVSVGGLGDGTGNAAMEEIVMALKYLENVELGIETTKFREIAEYVAI